MKSYLKLLAIYLLLILTTGIPLSRTATAHSTQEDIFSGLNVGSRVEITLRTNRSFKGEVKTIRPDRITLDISYDDPSLKGEISFSKGDIKHIILLTPMSQTEKDKTLTRKEKDLAAYRDEAKTCKPVVPKIKKKET